MPYHLFTPDKDGKGLVGKDRLDYAVKAVVMTNRGELEYYLPEQRAELNTLLKMLDDSFSDGQNSIRKALRDIIGAADCDHQQH